MPNDPPRSKYPLLNDALAAATLLGERHPASRVEALEALIDRVNPHFPRDSFPPKTLLHLLASPIGVADYELLRPLLPPETLREDLRAKFEAGENYVMLTFSWSPKKVGGYRQVTFHGQPWFTFPVCVLVERFTDMDDLANHGDECPQRLPENDPEWSDDCHCEPQLELRLETTYADDKAWAAGQPARAFIAQALAAEANQ